MKDLIPADSRYVPLVQQKDCCVPACYSMIMLRLGIPLISQEIIGHKLGLVIPERNAEYFWNPPIGKPHDAGYGTNVGRGNNKIDPDSVFRDLGIPLKTNFKLIDSFTNFDNFLNQLKVFIEDNKDVILCFEWGTFSNQKEKKWGHVCLLDTVNFHENTVRVIDPEYLGPKWKIVPIDNLYEAMIAHGSEKGGGFWEVVKT